MELYSSSLSYQEFLAESGHLLMLQQYLEAKRSNARNQFLWLMREIKIKSATSRSSRLPRECRVMRSLRCFLIDTIRHNYFACVTNRLTNSRLSHFDRRGLELLIGKEIKVNFRAENSYVNRHNVLRLVGRFRKFTSHSHKHRRWINEPPSIMHHFQLFRSRRGNRNETEYDPKRWWALLGPATVSMKCERCKNSKMWKPNGILGWPYRTNPSSAVKRHPQPAHKPFIWRQTPFNVMSCRLLNSEVFTRNL